MFKLFIAALFISLAGCRALPDATSSALRHGQMQVNGTTLDYVEQGEGIPVVFVHGSMSDARIWEAQRQPVASRFRYIALTQRYFGEGAWQDKGERFSQQTHAADLVAFVQGLNAGPVHLVAWSYGGSVATLAAIAHPELFRSVSLHEPTTPSLIAGSPDGKTAIAAFGSGMAPVREAAAKGDVALATSRFWEFIAILPPGGLEQEPESIRRIVSTNARTVPLTLTAPPAPVACSDIGKTRLPVLVTVGANTRPLWRQAGEAYRRCAGDGQLVVIPDSNHDAIFRRSSDFNRALLDFLAKH